MGNKNFITINGKKYDTVTGKLLHEGSSIPAKPLVSIISPMQNSGVVDGFVRKPVQKSHNTMIQHAHKQTQKSQTLMRRTVKKPSPSAKTVKPAIPSINKSQLGVSARRKETALQTPKSTAIQKYENPTRRTSVIQTNANIPVANAPINNHAQANHDTQPSHKPARSSAAQKMIEAALTNANSHTEQHPHQKKKRSKILRKLGISAKAAGMSAAILAGVLLGGFFAIQNVPNLSMRVAAARAGFDAQMPGYQPSGFSFKGPINYTTGKVVVSFESNSDDREYEVTQQASNWNSDALLSNYVVAGNKQYQTYLDRGRTLYIYDGSNATWVDNGVWYTVEGESDMTTDQLIRIAASI